MRWRAIAAVGAVAIAATASAGLTVEQPSPVCGADVGALLDRAASLLQALDDRGASALLAGRGADPCADVALAQLAVTGWVEARGLAPKGGDTALLAPVNTVLRALDALRRSLAVRPSATIGAGTRGLHIDYASAAIRAAVDAAQDERGEMAVYLDHARDLSSLLDAAGDPPIWPVPFEELEGELWFEVDRYTEARTAFRRAMAGGTTARSLVFLARIAIREADPEMACHSYRQALKLKLAADVTREAEKHLASCP
jgi:hypothetical protein